MCSDEREYAVPHSSIQSQGRTSVGNRLKKFSDVYVCNMQVHEHVKIFDLTCPAQLSGQFSFSCSRGIDPINNHGWVLKFAMQFLTLFVGS